MLHVYTVQFLTMVYGSDVEHALMDDDDDDEVYNVPLCINTIDVLSKHMLLLFQYDVSLNVHSIVAEAVDFIVQKATKKMGKQKFSTTHSGTNIVFETILKICTAAKEMELSKVYYIGYMIVLSGYS